MVVLRGITSLPSSITKSRPLDMRKVGNPTTCIRGKIPSAHGQLMHKDHHMLHSATLACCRHELHMMVQAAVLTELTIQNPICATLVLHQDDET